jgi:glycosyltransferase involved in cell wall biosynthesis
MNACAIIPCYNVGSRCIPVIREARRHVQRVLAIDDGSTDNTRACLTQTGVDLLSLERNRGKGFALFDGFSWVLRDHEIGVAMTLDGDGQHDAREIPTLLAAFCAGAGDLIIGARVGPWSSMPVSRRLANRCSSLLISRICGQRLPDSQSGFRLISRPALERLLPSLTPGRYETETQMLILASRLGFRISSVSIPTIYTQSTNAASSFHPLRDTFLVARVICHALWRSHVNTS